MDRNAEFRTYLQRALRSTSILPEDMQSIVNEEIEAYKGRVDYSDPAQAEAAKHAADQAINDAQIIANDAETARQLQLQREKAERAVLMKKSAEAVGVEPHKPQTVVGEGADMKIVDADSEAAEAAEEAAAKPSTAKKK